MYSGTLDFIVINIPIMRTPSTCQLYLVNDIYLQNTISYFRY